MLAAILVIAFSGSDSGAAGVPSPSAGSRAQAPQSRVSAPDKCLSARKAVAYYRTHTHERQSARGGALADRTPVVRGKSCHWARYAADVWVARARAALKALRAWEYDYAWWKWLPDKFVRVGRCETGGTSGATAAGNWYWDSGTYVSAFGIIRAAFPTWNGHNTPREQYEVAASIQARYGWGAWGCGGA